MTNGAIGEPVEGWLKELSALLGAPSGAVTRGKPVPSRVSADDAQLIWWRCSVGQPPVSVWIGASASDVAAVCGSSQTGDRSVEFGGFLDRASGITGEIAEEYPQAADYDTWRISTSGAGNKEEIEIFSVFIQTQSGLGQATAAALPGALPGYGTGALMDVELPLTLRFGSTRMPLQQLAGLGIGSVIEFDSALSDPVELMVNGRVIARGEAVVLQGCYALRISEIASPRERLFSAEQQSLSSQAVPSQ